MIYAPLINIQASQTPARRHVGSGRHADQRLQHDAAKRPPHAVAAANAGTAKIDQLISRLLEVARLSTRPGGKEWFDANEMVSHVVDASRFQLEASGVEVAVASLPHVWGDPVQLNQVFTNLVDNAIKYMGTSQRRRIDITCTKKGDRYRFAVKDTGPGIAVKDQEKVFRLFARLGTNGTTGEGVGLATVRAIINRHGGRIWVESVPGDGSTFYFTPTLYTNGDGQCRDAKPNAGHSFGTTWRGGCCTCLTKARSRSG
jgi:signal transduction histidine kinase